MSKQLIENVQKFEREELEKSQQEQEYMTQTITTDHYTLMLGDSCERMAEIPDQSVDLYIFSPPFQQLYVYSQTQRDLLKSGTCYEFYRHFLYIVFLLFRL